MVGMSVAESFIREQQRQAYLQQQLRTQQELGRDQEAIRNLQMQLAEQNAKVESLRAQQGNSASAPAAAPAESEAMMKLRLQLMQQEKELELVKQGK